MINIYPPSIIFTVINVLFLFFIMKKFLFGRVMDTINKREELLKGRFAEAEQKSIDADAKKTEYEQKLSDAKTKAEELIEEAHGTAAAQREKILAEAEEDAAAIREKAKSS
ncbi:MAG: ATP synthase F0 subunit B, partial [Eubacterium sp.]|nr:ATP synthase F0 subunit B [Eubacterium sp.]